MIGAYLIITGLFNAPFYFPRGPSKIELINEEQKLLYLIRASSAINKKHVTFLNYEKQEELYNKLLILDGKIKSAREKLEQNQKQYTTNYAVLSNTEQHIFTLQRALRGLPFLVGGFLLQAIGVLNELLIS